jgi:hypothetical protein
MLGLVGDTQTSPAPTANPASRTHGARADARSLADRDRSTGDERPHPRRRRQDPAGSATHVVRPRERFEEQRAQPHRIIHEVLEFGPSEGGPAVDPHPGAPNFQAQRSRPLPVANDRKVVHRPRSHRKGPLVVPLAVRCTPLQTQIVLSVATRILRPDEESLEMRRTAEVEAEQHVAPSTHPASREEHPRTVSPTDQHFGQRSLPVPSLVATSLLEQARRAGPGGEPERMLRADARELGPMPSIPHRQD